MTLTQTVNIPRNRRVHLDIDVPSEITADEAIVIVKFPDRAQAQTAIPPLPKEMTERAFAEHKRALEYIAEQKRKVETDPAFNTPGRGCLKGKIWMADDFCAPLEDFKDYM